MNLLYDTRTVHPLDRYDHYRAGAADEMAPVEVRGRAPGRLVATMTFDRVGELDLEELTWEADAEIVTLRTKRLIRADNQEQYRLLAAIDGEIHLEQADSRVRFRPGDIGMFDLSEPWRAAHPPEASRIRVAMLTFPRTMPSVDERALRSLNGTAIPRRQPGRDLMANLLTGLHGTIGSADHAATLAECTAGLIRHRLGMPDGITAQTRQMVYLTRIRDVIQAHLGDPTLDPDRIAKAVAISPRLLHKLMADTGATTMQLVKQMRLEECRRRLANPALHATPIREIFAACGYRRPDQFAHDFQQKFGITPTRARAERTDRET